MTRTRRFLVSLPIAAALYGILYVIGRQPGPHWNAVLLMPAWIVGAMVSGNPHQPNEIASAAVVFLMVLIFAYFIVALSDTWLTRSRSG